MPACSKCPQEAVTHLRYCGLHLCREHFLRFFDKRAKAQLANQGRIPEGRLMVALSGGKDSVAVLHFMHRLTRDHPRVELEAVTVDEGIQGYRDRAMESCRTITEDLGVPWHVVRTQDLAGFTIDAYAGGESASRPACGPCGVFRRTGMNQVARERDAAAVVTGHNLDDQAQTVLMNVLKADVDRLARLAPHGTSGPGLVPRLLPFRTIPEKEVLLYALLYGLPYHDEECPYAARAHRSTLRDVLLSLEETTPGTRHAVVRFQERLRPLLDSLDAPALAACPECGEPTSGALCKACVLRAPQNRQVPSP